MSKLQFTKHDQLQAHICFHRMDYIYRFCHVRDPKEAIELQYKVNSILSAIRGLIFNLSIDPTYTQQTENILYIRDIRKDITDTIATLKRMYNKLTPDGKENIICVYDHLLDNLKRFAHVLDHYSKGHPDHDQTKRIIRQAKRHFAKHRGEALETDTD